MQRDRFNSMPPPSILLKIGAFLSVLMVLKPIPTRESWAIVMTLMAALWLVPLGFEQSRQRFGAFEGWKWAIGAHLVVVLALCGSFLLEKGTTAAILATPYPIWCAAVAVGSLRLNSRRLSDWVHAIAWGFLTNAAIWLVFDRLDLQPLGFSAWIVLLTGVHFHFAGFALTQALALLLNQSPNNNLARWASFGVLLGVVATATGITTSQLGMSSHIETFAGVLMAISSILSALAYFFAAEKESAMVHLLWQIGSFCLFLAMILAFLYAIRRFYPISFLTIPNMQAIHGSLNALGFGTLILLGWAVKT